MRGMKDKCYELITRLVLVNKLIMKYQGCPYLNPLEKCIQKMHFEMVVAMGEMPI